MTRVCLCFMHFFIFGQLGFGRGEKMYLFKIMCALCPSVQTAHPKGLKIQLQNNPMKSFLVLLSLREKKTKTNKKKSPKNLHQRPSVLLGLPPLSTSLSIQVYVLFAASLRKKSWQCLVLRADKSCFVGVFLCITTCSGGNALKWLNFWKGLSTYCLESRVPFKI